MYIRILSIRKHKNVAFINGYGNEFGSLQFMIKNEVFGDLKCGDLININCIDTVNKHGDRIKEIIKINFIVPCASFESYKGVNSLVSDVKFNDYLDARNCGSQLKILKFKQELIRSIKDILDNLSFFDATSLLISAEHYKNGSGIIDAEIANRNGNVPKYLRVTLESQLKQMVGTILQSCYAIDKVYRNMGEDNAHINEFLMFEFVAISLTLDEIIAFVKRIDGLSREVASNHGLNVPGLNNIDVVDYNDLAKFGMSFDNLKRDLNNFLVVNYPSNSPFIKSNLDTGMQTETRWYMRGHWISHFYEDENNFKHIQNAIKAQDDANAKEDTNPLDYFMWGLPYTTSFGLSIDRWLQMILNKGSITSVSNPIGLDYRRSRLK
ncbi:MAG: hypothetical protein E7161_00665 [Firmicutes bacterium]|nr:hypothetical protein [Bacillota bacterium]